MRKDVCRCRIGRGKQTRNTKEERGGGERETEGTNDGGRQRRRGTEGKRIRTVLNNAAALLSVSPQRELAT